MPSSLGTNWCQMKLANLGIIKPMSQYNRKKSNWCKFNFFTKTLLQNDL